MIKGNNINLRMITDKDLDQFYILDTDLSNRGEYYTMELTAKTSLVKWYNETGLWDDDFGRMLIVDKEDNILGYINYFKTIRYFNSLEIWCILFDKIKRGMGISTEALELFIDYIFRAKNVNRLEIRIHPDNIASQKATEKCGFIFEGIIRGAMIYKDSYTDLKQYSLLREEYYETKKDKK